MSTQKRTTLADVARLAGTSSAAASMILNNRPDTRLSDDARQRVRAAAEELGYRPNLAARGLRTEKTNTIGFISDYVSVTRFASGQIRGALQAAENADHVLLVIETGDDPVREARAVEASLDRRADGLIFAAMQAREVDLPAVPADTRVVLLNATNPLVSATVRPAEFEGGRSAIRAALTAGHQNEILLLGQNRAREGDLRRSPNIEARVSGIFAEMEAHNLAFVAELAVSDWTADESYAALRDYLATQEAPSCVVVLNDPMAFGVYRTLSEAGLKIPEDISVISFDNDELAEYLRPGLTTVALPYEEMGAAAVKLLLSGESADWLIPMPLIERESLAPPRPTGAVTKQPAPTVIAP